MYETRAFESSNNYNVDSDTNFPSINSRFEDKQESKLSEHIMITSN